MEGSRSLRSQTVDLCADSGAGCWARTHSKRRLGGGLAACAREPGDAGCGRRSHMVVQGAGEAGAAELRRALGVKSKLHCLAVSCYRPLLWPPSPSVKWADANTPTSRVRGGPRHSLTPGLGSTVASEVMTQVGGRPGWARRQGPLAEAGCWRCEVHSRDSRRQLRWRVRGIPLRTRWRVRGTPLRTYCR